MGMNPDSITILKRRTASYGKKHDPDYLPQQSRYRKRNIVRYILLLFSSLVYAYFYGGIFPYTLLYLMLALPVISAIHMAIVCFFQIE